jgi:rhodanese-related sulfurtransferase
LTDIHVTTDNVPAEQLSHFQPLAFLGEATLRQMAPHCRIERVARNLDPFRLRDWQGQVVYLLKGQLKLEFADGSVEVLVGGLDQALLPLSDERAGPVSSKAITDIELLCVEENALDMAITWQQLVVPSPGGTGEATETNDWRSTTGVFLLRELTQGAFSALPPANIRALIGRFREVKVKRGQVIVKEGDVGDYYYLIESGRCLVTRLQGGVPARVAELDAGGTFGEEALVAETLRNATVSMETDGVLLRLAKADFVELLREPLLKRLDPAAARKKITEGAIWLDVRLPVEWRHDGLPGAINLPLNELRSEFQKLEADQDYIVYCQTGRRSSAATFLLGQRGLRAYLLTGGLRLWQQLRRGQ